MLLQLRSDIGSQVNKGVDRNIPLKLEKVELKCLNIFTHKQIKNKKRKQIREDMQSNKDT